MLCRTRLLPRTPPWATRNLLSNPASPPKPGQLPTPGTTHRALPPRQCRGCLPARPPPTCLLDPLPRECTLPSPPEPLLPSLLGRLAPLPAPLTRPRALPHLGSTLLQACPSQNSPGPTGAQQSRPRPLPPSGRGGPCLPEEGGAPLWGVSTLRLVCRTHPQGRIPLRPRHRGPLLQCRGAPSPLDHGGLRRQPHFPRPQGPIRLQDCTQHRRILTKCHLRPLELRPCRGAFILTVELVPG